MVLGHESSGTVVSVGPSVRSLKPGDNVAMEPGIPCRRCVRCKDGKYNLCPEMAFAATPPYDGTLAKYYVLPEDFCYKLPAGMSLDEGALVEPLAVAVHIITQAGVLHGDNVVVFGAGPVGLLICAVAQVFGARKVIAVDIQESRLAFAREFAGTATYVSQRVTAEENARNLIEQNNLGSGADVAIDASGAEPSVQTAIHVLRTGGTYVQGGMGKDNITFPIMAACIKELTLKGSFRYGSGDYKLAVELVADKKVEVMKLVTSKVSFENAELAFFQAVAGKEIKILIGGSGEGEPDDLDDISTPLPLTDGVKDVRAKHNGVTDRELEDAQDYRTILAESRDPVATHNTEALATQTDDASAALDGEIQTVQTHAAPAVRDTDVKTTTDSKDAITVQITETKTPPNEKEDTQVNHVKSREPAGLNPNASDTAAKRDEDSAAARNTSTATNGASNSSTPGLH